MRSNEQRWNDCCHNLLHGKYDWPEHEVICSGKVEHQGKYCKATDFGKPVWQGEKEPIRLLINADFGMGDTIQFWRFVPLAKERVAHVFLRCDEDFKHLFHSVDVVGKEEELPEFDKVIHMMALPNVLNIGNNISGKPYLEPNHKEPDTLEWQVFESVWKMECRFSKIGICWDCNPFGPAAHLKSLPRNVWDNFIAILPPQMKFLSLNKLACDEEFFWDMRNYMQDWNQTARLINFLDLLISVDTAVAHLAGALGRPVWLLKTDEYHDWRWGLLGSRTPWYDSMSIYRREGNWQGIVERMARRLMIQTHEEWGLPELAL